MEIVLAFDIGGTHSRAAATTPTGFVLRRAQAPTPAGLAEGLAMLWDLGRAVVADDTVTSIGVSIGGPLDWRTGIVSPLHQPAWRGVPLRAILADRFGCPNFIDVDTNIAAAAEYLADGRRPGRLLYLTLSTGMGGGFVVDGRIYRGTEDAHPEIAHQAIAYRCRHPERVVCECGAVGCLEALISGNGIRRIYGVPAEALDGDAWDEVAFNLGQGLRNLTVILAPDVIVLGGSVALGGAARLLDGATTVMREHLRIVPPPDVRLSTLGADSPLLGAIAVARLGYDPIGPAAHAR